MPDRTQGVSLHEYAARWPLLLARMISAITACYLAVGILSFVVWQLSGNMAWVVEFFGVPAAVLMVCLGGTEFGLSILATQHFAPDDLLRPGWVLIACSGGCQTVGFLCSQIFGAHSRLNPFTNSAEPLIPLARDIGLLIGGTFRFALLAAGLHFALKAYQRSGWLGRLRWIDWAVLVGFIAYLVRNVVDVVAAMHRGKVPDVWEVLGWPVDPLLCLLLVQALLLLRSTAQMNGGIVARCWRAFSVGIFLTAIGDVGMWAFNYGYLPWPWNSLTWYVWLPAAAAFACAPAFQLEVIRDAESGMSLAKPDFDQPLNP